MGAEVVGDILTIYSSLYIRYAHYLGTTGAYYLSISDDYYCFYCSPGRLQ